ncbi:unnamed protein product [Rotaria sp. Silwood1]|nr:unnamed protein product [Rotaria sp. Silwood1]CAF1595308.1 unnamed protein product [Rotaria sp. Silwood1]CAF3654727.1 unnamed protein product [Rotaria sp. Silwood1]CAF3696322.1 unnamed protein product [Rotaria sp. Silwood1]CAF3718065.1 unnamed protein product [Rotaria sp. Silwood1]
MKSKDLRQTVVRMTNDGLSAREIAKQLRMVDTDHTIRRWQHLYKTTGTIDLNTPVGRPRIVRTKHLMNKVKHRFNYKRRRSARQLAKSLGISKGIIGRIIREDLHLHAYHVTTQPNLKDDYKQPRISFAYCVNKSLRKKDRGQILFTDEKYFGLDGILNRQNDRVYAASRQEADEHGGTRPVSKFPKRILVWLGASRNGLTTPIIFKPGETLKHINYIKVVLPHALAEGRRLLGDDFIYQQDNATPHTHKKSITWIKKNFKRFIDAKKWPPNSPDLNILDYHVWDAIGHHTH